LREFRLIFFLRGWAVPCESPSRFSSPFLTADTRAITRFGLALLVAADNAGLYCRQYGSGRPALDDMQQKKYHYLLFAVLHGVKLS
jgi:hypothetical protein